MADEDLPDGNPVSAVTTRPAVAQESSVMHGFALQTVTYDSPQERANTIVPLGWCNACIGEAKAAEDKGVPAEPIQAAVTMAPTPVSTQAPMGLMAGLLALPTCWGHIGGVPPG